MEIGKTINTSIEIAHDGMRALVSPSASLVLLDDSAQHTEGPVYVPADESVVWSDVKGDRLLRWRAGEVSVLRSPAHFQNGNALDLEGRIVGCSHRDRAIVRQEKDGQWSILVDCYQGKQLNSPNDVVVKSDGTIWFTDPPFGLTQPEEGCGGEQEQPGSFVFRFDPTTGDIDAVVTDMKRPNGLAFSPDESLLYISDTSAVENPQLCHSIQVYDMVDGRKAKNGRVFVVVEPGQPDGFCIDSAGNVFTSSADSVQVYSPEGLFLGKIKIPEICANLTFGGVERNQLFITAGNSLYRIDVKSRGAS